MAASSTHVDRRKLLQSEELTGVFWKLSTSHKKERATGVATLVNLLIQKQNGVITPCQEIAYSIQRLVRGLSSSRKAARLGFFTALVQVLKTFPEAINSNDVLELAEQQLEIPGSKKNDIDMALGHLLLYSALVRAKRVDEADVVKKIIEGLHGCIQKTSNLKTLVQVTMSELITLAPNKVFKKVIYNELQKDLSVGWETCTPYQLGLVLTVQENKPESFKKLGMSDTWGKHLISKKHYDSLKRIFLEATDTHPNVHPLLKKIVDLAMKNSSFQEFWNEVVDNGLAMAPGKDKKFLAFELAKYALSRVQSKEEVSVVLSPNLLHCYLSHQTVSASVLHSDAAAFGKFLVQFVEKSERPDLQWAILSRVIECGSILVDHKTRSDVIKRMSSAFKGEANTSFLQLLKNEILIKGETKEEDDLRRTHASGILSQVISHRTDSSLEVLRFLALHAFFHIKKTDDSIPECSQSPVGITPEIRNQLQSSFLRGLDRLATQNKQASSLAWQTEVTHNLVLYLDTLIHQPKLVQIVRPLTEKGLIGWSVMLSIVKKVKKYEHKGSANLLILKLFTLNIGLFLLIDPDRAVEVLQELAECSTRILAAERKGSGDRKWVNVMVELLLSVLCDGRHFLRCVATLVLKQLVPHLTPDNVRSILKVLVPGAEKGDLFESEDDMDAEDEIKEEAAGSGEEGVEEGGENESSSEDESIDESDVEDVDEEFKRKVQAAMGKAAHVDEDDDEIWDDDMMMKMKFDESVAELFRNKKKSLKHKMSKKESMLLHFRLRAVDLVDVMIRSEPPLWMVLTMVPVLTSCLDHFAKLVLKHRQYLALMQRLRKSVSTLIKVKAKRGEAVEEEVYMEALEDIISVADRGKGAASDETICNVGAFILSCARHAETSPVSAEGAKQTVELGVISQKLVDKYRDTVKEVFRGNSNLRFTLLKSLFQRHRDLGWSFHDVLMDHAFNPDTKLYFRTQAAMMIRVEILRHADALKHIPDNEWKKFCKQLQKKIHYVLTELTGVNSEVKPNGAYVEQILELLYIVFNINPKRTVQGAVNEELLHALAEIDVNRKMTKRLINRILTKFPEISKQRKERLGQKHKDLVKIAKEAKELKESQAVAAAVAPSNETNEDKDEESSENQVTTPKSKGIKRKKDKDESNWEKSKRKKRNLEKKNRNKMNA